MNTHQKPTSTFRKRLRWIPLILFVVAGLLIIQSTSSSCKRLADDLDNASAVTASYQYGTEMFYFAASKIADIRAEMRQQNCPVAH